VGGITLERERPDDAPGKSRRETDAVGAGQPKIDDDKRVFGRDAVPLGTLEQLPE
jgi:hypothetical protein